MSLLSEVVGTVLQANATTVGSVQNIHFTGTINGVNVITGTLAPRETQVSLLFQDASGEPLKLPTNALPVKAIFVPITEIESSDLTDTFFNFALYDNVELNNMYQPWSSYSDCDGNRMNAKMVLDLVDVSGSVADVATYPYVGMAMGGTSPVTAGSVQLYLYYV